VAAPAETLYRLANKSTREKDPPATETPFYLAFPGKHNLPRECPHTPQRKRPFFFFGPEIGRKFPFCLRGPPGSTPHGVRPPKPDSGNMTFSFPSFPLSQSRNRAVNKVYGHPPKRPSRGGSSMIARVPLRDAPPPLYGDFLQVGHSPLALVRLALARKHAQLIISMGVSTRMMTGHHLSSHHVAPAIFPIPLLRLHHSCSLSERDPIPEAWQRRPQKVFNPRNKDFSIPD